MEKKSKKKTIFTIFLLMFVALGSLSLCYASARWYQYNVLPVWSVDSGKHMDWDGTTKYLSNFNVGVSTWNNYKSGVIREDTALVLEDIDIFDIDFIENNVMAATWHPDIQGKSDDSYIMFATTQMDNLTTAQKNLTCTHELGHALGLGENNSNGTNLVMYNVLFKNTSNNVLHDLDKFNYDYLYNNKY